MPVPYEKRNHSAGWLWTGRKRATAAARTSTRRSSAAGTRWRRGSRSRCQGRGADRRGGGGRVFGRRQSQRSVSNWGV